MIIVVGGAGYVGSVLCRDLVNRGHEVKVFDRGLFGLDGINSFLVDVIIKDQRDIDVHDFYGADTVINIGGLSNDPTAEWAREANMELNGHNAGYLAECAGAAGVKRYIFGSSCSIYDRGVFDTNEQELLTEEALVDPKAAYSSAKLLGEQKIAEIKEGLYPELETVILRKGTLFGFSPRMRYDLVVNTFVRHAMESGKITAFYGGRMWRPLCSVQDASKAYIMVATADSDRVDGQIFNVVAFNTRISELALEVAEYLRISGVDVDVFGDQEYQSVRSYQVSGAKLIRELGWFPEVPLGVAVKHMVHMAGKGYSDFHNPKYYNIAWLKSLGTAAGILKKNFNLDPDDLLETLR